jgi:hypothetical protein
MRRPTRLTGAVLSTAVLCAVAAAPAYATKGAARQEVSLHGRFLGNVVSGGASSLAGGRDPKGFVHLAGNLYNLDATVTCLAVSGGLATIGFRIDAGQHAGAGFLMTVQDNGPTAPGFVPSDVVLAYRTVPLVPASCPAPAAQGPGDRMDEGEIVVTPVGGSRPRNRRPEAHGDALSAGAPVPANVDVLANDTDPDGDALTVSSYSQGKYGTVACRANGACIYTPGPRSATRQQDTFRYRVRDPDGARTRGQVQISLLHHVDAVSITGNATVGTESLYASANFSAVSGPSGEAPIGSGSFVGFGFPVAGPVTCLRVTGNTAILNIIDDAFYGMPVNVAVTDNGGHGQDTIDMTGGGPSDCSSFTPNSPPTRRALNEGRAIVFDAVP